MLGNFPSTSRINLSKKDVEADCEDPETQIIDPGDELLLCPTPCCGHFYRQNFAIAKSYETSRKVNFNAVEFFYRKDSLDEACMKQQEPFVRLAWRLMLRVEGSAFSDAKVEVEVEVVINNASRF